MKNKFNSKLLIVLLSLIFIIPLISAVTIIPYSSINDTVISSKGLNLTLNCTQQIYFGAIINNNSIYIENINSNDDILNSLSYNLTETNKIYFCSDLPIFTSTSPTSSTITSGLTNQINASVSTSTGLNNQISKITTSNGQTFTFSGTNPNPLTLNNVILNNGNTILTIENNKQIQGICEKGGLSLMDSVTLVGMILTILLISGVLAMLIGVFSGYLDMDKMKNNIDLQGILIGVCTIGLTGLLLVTVAYVFSSAYCGALGV